MINSTGHSHSVLSEAVHTYMHSIGEAYHEDVMRAFFRLRASDIGQLLPYAKVIVERSTHERGRSLSNALPEANSIILVCPQIHEKLLFSGFVIRQF
jgi:nuclear pore complex protein Nup133